MSIKKSIELNAYHEVQKVIYIKITQSNSEKQSHDLYYKNNALIVHITPSSVTSESILYSLFLMLNHRRLVVEKRAAAYKVITEVAIYSTDNMHVIKRTTNFGVLRVYINYTDAP